MTLATPYMNLIGKGSDVESNRFDRLTQNVSAEGAGRRQILCALASVALGSVAARLGLPDVTEAKTKHHQTGQETKHKSQAKRKKHGSLHDEGKRKGKGKKGKGHHHQPPPVPPLPPGCQNCTECQMCQDGACVPDPDLNGIVCQGSGADCGYCQGGQCATSPIPKCGDGFCPSREDKCCSDEKRCPDQESSTGFACLGTDDCCPDQKKCAGSCIYKQACCDAERPQNCGQCGAACHQDGTWGCSAQRPCPNGTCVAHDMCCPGETHCDICPAAAESCRYEDVIQFTCGDDPLCYCHMSTSGETHCLHVQGGGYYRCQVDADCNGFYPSTVETFCNACNHLCYLKGCRALGDW